MNFSNTVVDGKIERMRRRRRIPKP